MPPAIAIPGLVNEVATPTRPNPFKNKRLCILLSFYTLNLNQSARPLSERIGLDKIKFPFALDINDTQRTGLTFILDFLPRRGCHGNCTG